MAAQVKRAVPSVKDLNVKDDVALGITFQVGLDDKRQLVIQTYVDRDASPEELNGVLDKIVKASDRIDLTYRKRALKKEIETLTDLLAKHHDDQAALEERWQADWAQRGKRGDFAPDGQQKSTQEQARVLQARQRSEISRLETELHIVERRLRE